jgi:hypothetical protein
LDLKDSSLYTNSVLRLSNGGVLQNVTGNISMFTNDSGYATLASPTFTGTVGGITKSMVGLGNVDNTTDAAKPVSTATNTLLQSTSALLTPLTTTNNLTGQLVLTTTLNSLSGTLLTRTDYSTSSATFFRQNGNAFGTQAIIGTIDNNAFSVNTNNSEKMRIFANGNVAYDDFNNMPGAAGNSTYKVMHYASPTGNGSAMLSMASRGAHTVFFGNLSNTGFIIGSEGTSRGISFKQGLSYGDSNTLGTGTTVMHIAGNGNVGIGTNLTTPNQLLTVSGNISATGSVNALGGNSNNWNSNYTTTLGNSASWTNASSTVSALSATWSLGPEDSNTIIGLSIFL